MTFFYAPFPVASEAPPLPLVTMVVTYAGVPYGKRVLFAGFNASGDRVTGGSGTVPFRMQVPVDLLNLVAWSVDGEAITRAPSNYPADMVLSFDDDGGPVTGEPAQIRGAVTERDSDGQVSAASRRVVAVQWRDGTWRVVGAATSDEQAAGAYTIAGLVDPDADVYLMALDDHGDAFTPSALVSLDDLIHPTEPNGYVYRVVAAGTLPATEPQWWTSGQKQMGTATLEASEYLRPLAHGPVDVTFV